MATLTLTLDPELLQSIMLEAERRHITLDQFFADSVSTYTPNRPRKRDNSNLTRLMNEGALGQIDRPLTREEIYAERTWPRP